MTIIDAKVIENNIILSLNSTKPDTIVSLTYKNHENNRIIRAGQRGQAGIPQAMEERKPGKVFSERKTILGEASGPTGREADQPVNN